MAQHDMDSAILRDAHEGEETFSVWKCPAGADPDVDKSWSQLEEGWTRGEAIALATELAILSPTTLYVVLTSRAGDGENIVWHNANG